MSATAGRLSLGTAPLGGLFTATDDATARATIDRAWELGVRHFDTAPLYGSGLAERRLGEALRSRPRHEFTITTKVGRLLRPGTPDPLFKGAPPLRPVADFTPDGLRRSLEESLSRLGLDRVDTVLLHDPEDHLQAAVAAVDGLRELDVEVGVGTNHVQTALTFVRDAAIDHVLIAGRYTPLDPSAGQDLLPLCAKRGVNVCAAGVFNSGLLVGGSTFDYSPAPSHLIAQTRTLELTCRRYGVPLAALAIQFPLRHPSISTVVVGAATPSEIEQDAAFLNHPIAPELWQELPVPARGVQRG
jgi:D-threo-aldose 1-dehydrogenase